MFLGKRNGRSGSPEGNEAALELNNECLDYTFPNFGENKKVQGGSTKSEGPK